MLGIKLGSEQRLRLALWIVALLLCGVASVSEAHAAPITYRVMVSTSAISGTQGYLDLQFNPGGAAAQPATTSITNFASAGGTLGSVVERIGDATGTLPGTVRLNNSLAINNLFQAFTFGSGFSFDLSITGPAVDAPLSASSGSGFFLALFDTDQQTPLLTINPAGLLLSVQLTPSGTATVQTFGSSPNLITVTPQTAAIPEPATILLLGTGLATIGTRVYRRRGGNNERRDV